MREKIKPGSVVLINETYFYKEDFCNKKFKVIGTKEGRKTVLIQLTNDKGHDGCYNTLDDGRQTKDLNLSNVWWVDNQFCELVYTKYTLKELEGKRIVIHCDSLENLRIFDKHIALTNGNFPSSIWTEYDIDTCFKIYPTGMTYASKSYFETEENFEVIDFNRVIFNEDYKMKYKLIRDVNGDALNKDNACITEFDKYVKKYGFWKVCIWNETNEEFMLTQNGWIKFLLDKGYIEEIKPEIVYDENKIYIVVDKDGDVYKLHILDHEEESYAFIDLNSTECWLDGEYDEAQKGIDNNIDRVKVYDSFNDFVADYNC